MQICSYLIDVNIYFYYRLQKQLKYKNYILIDQKVFETKII